LCRVKYYQRVILLKSEFICYKPNKKGSLLSL
jgi:hypothetical protein